MSLSAMTWMKERLAIRSVSTQHALVQVLWSHVSVYFCHKCVFNFF